MAVLVVNLGRFGSEASSVGANTRNVLLHTAAGLAVVWLGYPRVAWLPPFGYTIACMLFGYPRHQLGYDWWAVVMQDRVTIGQAVTVGVLYAAAVLAFVFAPPGSAFRHLVLRS
ncbi:MAG TPA: hypothetical protein VF174_01210 [Micromonosporaceae bacterium]